MHRIAVLTEQETRGAQMEEQIARFCTGAGRFPASGPDRNRGRVFKGVRGHAVIALPGVAGLNAVERLRALCPACRIIWCSDLDFSLHAFRLRVDYFLLEPVTEEGFRRGLLVWLEGRTSIAPCSFDSNNH